MGIWKVVPGPQLQPQSLIHNFNAMTDSAGTTSHEAETSPSLKDMRKFERWRKSLQYITGLGMTEEERQTFRKQLDAEIEQVECKNCELWRDSLMKNS